MSKIYGQLEFAQLENKSSDAAAATIGRIWWNTSTALMKIDNGAAILTVADISTAQTLTNKSMSGGSNTFTNIPNGATTATSSNTASAIVARDGSGNFTAGTITASLTGTASGNLQATANQYGVLLSGSGNTASVLAPDASTVKVLVSGGASANPAWGTVAATAGGTGQTAWTAGDLPYASATNTIGKLGIGTQNQVLSTSNGLPAWVTPAAGGVNYLSGNPDAEVDTTGWSTYADAAQNTPVDGTGGSPTSTWTRSTSTPLRKTGSFLWTRGAANRQGEGVAYAFSIDEADQGRVLKISFDYKVVSGTFFAADGTTAPLNDGTTSVNNGMSDLEIFIYDVTNSALIPVSPQVLTSTSSVSASFVGQFQSAINSKSYRFIIHTARSTAVAFTAQFDNFILGPQAQLLGPPVTDWVTESNFTPAAAAFGTISLKSIQYRRVGDTMLVRGYWKCGTVAASAALISFPSWIVLDTTKFSSASSAVRLGTWTRVITSGSAANVASGNNEGPLYYEGTTSRLGFANQVQSDVFVAANGNTIFSTSDGVMVEFAIPVVGWSSTTQMSNDTDTRVVAARCTLAGSTSISASTNTIIPFDGTTYDTHGAISGLSGSSFKFTAPVAGWYRVTTVLEMASASWTQANRVEIDLYKNGSVVSAMTRYHFPTTGTYPVNLNGVELIKLVAGDYLAINLIQTEGTRSMNGSSALNFVTFERVSGPSTIAASDIVAFNYGNAATTAVTSITTNPCDTKLFDTHNAVASGVFTAPISGKYEFGAAVGVKGGTFALNDVVQLDIIQAGSASVTKTQKVYVAAAVTQQNAQIVTSLNLVAGDTVQSKITSARASSTLSGTVNENIFFGHRIGN